jgi:NIPSNAP
MQQVNRRQFARILAGFAAASALAKPRCIALDAFAASRLPQSLIIHNVDQAAIFELRVYAAHPRAMPAVLERHGIRPAVREQSATGIAYLIPFESLQARQRAWDAFNADPDWHAMRASGPVNLNEISLYRAAATKPLAFYGSTTVKRPGGDGSRTLL